MNYKYRMHDPRIGRFFAVDPLAGKYAYNSPYAFSENRVIDGVELEGLELGWVMEQTAGIAMDVVEVLPTAESVQALSDDIDSWLMGKTYTPSPKRYDEWGLIKDGTHYLAGGDEGNPAIQTDEATFDNSSWFPGAQGLSRGKHYKMATRAAAKAQGMRPVKGKINTALSPTRDNGNGHQPTKQLDKVGSGVVNPEAEAIEAFNTGTSSSYTPPTYGWKVVSENMLGCDTEYRQLSKFKDHEQMEGEDYTIFQKKIGDGWVDVSNDAFKSAMKEAQNCLETGKNN